MSEEIKKALGASHMMSMEQIAAERLALINENARLRAELSRVKAERDEEIRNKESTFVAWDAAQAEVARLRSALERARAFVGGLRGSQFTNENQHREAFGVIHAIDAALSPAPSPVEEKPCECICGGDNEHEAYCPVSKPCPCKDGFYYSGMGHWEPCPKCRPSEEAK